MGRTVLVLDDDALFQAMVSPALEGRGLKVIQALNAAQADAALARDVPDVLVVDGLLPGISGIDWIAKQRAAGNELPILFVSAFWRDTGTAKRLTGELKVAQVIAKPVAPDVLAEKVEAELLKRAPTAPPPEETSDPTGVEFEITDGPPPYLREPSELALVQADAARTLSGKIRELTEALKTAQVRLDRGSILEARIRAQKLVSLAKSCGFGDLVRSTSRIEEGIRKVEASPRSAPADTWTALDATTHEALQQTKQVVKPRDPGPSRPRRLLVVDVDPAVLKHIRALVPHGLAELLAATTSTQALKLAKESPPGAAILNAELEDGLSGLDLGHLLRTVPGCAGLPLSFISGLGREQVQAARDAGAVSVLSKPLNRDAVIEAVSQMLGVAAPPRSRVVVVTDDPELNEEVPFWLARHGFEAQRLPASSATPAQLDASKPDALLLDVGQPGGAGLRLCRTVRSFPRWRELPVIGLAGAGTASRIAALDAGADDCLSRPMDFEELMARVRSRLDRATSFRERIERDALTGLALRHAFLEALAQRLADARRSHRTLTLCLMRLEDVARVNETRGLQAGDELIAAFARLLVDRFRVEDLRGRWSGASFVVCFQGSNSTNIQRVLTRLRQDLANLAPASSDGQPLHPTFTSGLASSPADGNTVMELLQAADGRLTHVRSPHHSQPLGATPSPASSPGTTGPRPLPPQLSIAQDAPPTNPRGLPRVSPPAAPPDRKR